MGWKMWFEKFIGSALSFLILIFVTTIALQGCYLVAPIDGDDSDSRIYQCRLEMVPTEIPKMEMILILHQNQVFHATPHTPTAQLLTAGATVL